MGLADCKKRGDRGALVEPCVSRASHRVQTFQVKTFTFSLEIALLGRESNSAGETEAGEAGTAPGAYSKLIREQFFSAPTACFTLGTPDWECTHPGPYLQEEWSSICIIYLI